MRPEPRSASDESPERACDPMGRLPQFHSNESMSVMNTSLTLLLDPIESTSAASPMSPMKLTPTMTIGMSQPRSQPISRISQFMGDSLSKAGGVQCAEADRDLPAKVQDRRFSNGVADRQLGALAAPSRHKVPVLESAMTCYGQRWISFKLGIEDSS